MRPLKSDLQAIGSLRCISFKRETSIVGYSRVDEASRRQRWLWPTPFLLMVCTAFLALQDGSLATAAVSGGLSTYCLRKLPPSGETSNPKADRTRVFDLPSFGLQAVVPRGYGEVLLHAPADGPDGASDFASFAVSTGGIGGGISGIYESAKADWIYAFGYSVRIEKKDGTQRFGSRVALPILFTDNCDSDSACAVSDGAYSAALKRVFFTGRTAASRNKSPDALTIEVVGSETRVLTNQSGNRLYYEGDSSNLHSAILRDDAWTPYVYDGIHPPSRVINGELIGGDDAGRWVIRDKAEIKRTEIYSYRRGYFSLDANQSLKKLTVPAEFLTSVPQFSAIPGSGEIWLFSSDTIYKETSSDIEPIAKPGLGRIIRDSPAVRYVVADNSIHFSTSNSASDFKEYALMKNDPQQVASCMSIAKFPDGRVPD